MKTTVEYIGFTCPLCEIDEILPIDRFILNLNSLRFETKKEYMCPSCDCSFTPTINLEEFKEA